MFCRLGDIARPFVLPGGFSPLRQSEAIFREVMTHLITHQGGFTGGVVEHPKSDPCAEGVPSPPAKGGLHAVFHVSILDIWVGRDL